MRCTHCGANTGLRKRKDGRCSQCQHRFAFPTGQLTDVQFKRAVDRISGYGKVLFTERNLWYEVQRRWRPSGPWRKAYHVFPPALLGAMPGAVLAFWLSIPGLYWLPAAGAAGSVVASVFGAWSFNRSGPPPVGAPSIPFDRFRSEHLSRWIAVHGPIPGLLPPPEQAAAGMPIAVPADVAAFSFDRALVTDRWETAQMLVANRFHFEHNCAVLSMDGYPAGIAGTIREMLRRNPRLTVFALHDASVDGCHLPLALRQPEWFPDLEVRIVDLGLRPATARRLRLPGLRGRAAYRLPPLVELHADEVRWLSAGTYAELAAVRPMLVMRAAYKAIVTLGRTDRAGSRVPYQDGGVIWIGDLGRGVDTAVADGFG
jgi:hypothetical protein